MKLREIVTWGCFDQFLKSPNEKNPWKTVETLVLRFPCQMDNKYFEWAIYESINTKFQVLYDVYVVRGLVRVNSLLT